MEHVAAVENLTAERYLLGELSAAEMEEFELHYFECQECALAVSSCEIFHANACAVLASAAVVPDLPPAGESARTHLRRTLARLWMRPLAACSLAAALVFAGIAIYQGAIVIPGMRRVMEMPRALPAFELFAPSRGERSKVQVPAGTQAISLSADIPPGVQFPLYRCRLTVRERVVFELAAPAPAAGHPISILVPVRELQPGTCELSMRGLDPAGRESDTSLSYPFDFQVN